MKYIIIDFENEQYWLETGDEGYAIRQLIFDINGQCHISCLEDCLAEGQIDEEEFDGNIYHITKHEFDIKWNAATTEKRKLWDVLKKQYPMGKEVEGITMYSYPQGWILNIGHLLGVCQSSLNLNPGTTLSGRIIGYDEVNMWVVISFESDS